MMPRNYLYRNSPALFMNGYYGTIATVAHQGRGKNRRTSEDSFQKNSSNSSGRSPWSDRLHEMISKEHNFFNTIFIEFFPGFSRDPGSYQ
jgi:hypothetical protein